ncbi:MAG: S9 family peptidase, partial [Sphingobacteriaceae bacterium]
MSSRIYRLTFCVLLFILSGYSQKAQAQFGQGTVWAKDGYRYYKVQDSVIMELDVRDESKKTIIADKAALTPSNGKAISVRRFSMSADGKRLLINTNTKKVWRYDTRGDYWVYDIGTKTLKQMGKGKPASSLMFAKFSPDGSKVAYVSEHNIYLEDLTLNTIKALTTDGTQKLINGTFDWAYEEEFA